MRDLDAIAKHFCIAAIWADAPEGTHPRETRAALRWARDFAERFITAHPELCAAAMACDGYGSHPDAGSPDAAFGHDLYLTCAGHGVGFWYRDELGETGKALGDVIRADWRTWYVETEFYRGWLHLA